MLAKLFRKPDPEPVKALVTWAHRDGVMLASLPSGEVLACVEKFPGGVFKGFDGTRWLTKEQAMRSHEAGWPQYDWAGGPKPAESAA
jgi:hypothetical protein